MPVGWALVTKGKKPEEQARFANVHNLKNLASGQPWANAVSFTVTTPLSVSWTEPEERKHERHWDAVVEIDGVAKGQLKPIFQFIHDNCSHVDGIG